jgi:hypothetical protein
MMKLISRLYTHLTSRPDRTAPITLEDIERANDLYPVPIHNDDLTTVKWLDDILDVG